MEKCARENTYRRSTPVVVLFFPCLLIHTVFEYYEGADKDEGLKKMRLIVSYPWIISAAKEDR